MTTIYMTFGQTEDLSKYETSPPVPANGCFAFWLIVRE